MFFCFRKAGLKLEIVRKLINLVINVLKYLLATFLGIMILGGLMVISSTGFYVADAVLLVGCMIAMFFVVRSIRNGKEKRVDLLVQMASDKIDEQEREDLGDTNEKIMLEGRDLLKEAELLKTQIKSHDVLEITTEILEVANSIFNKTMKSPDLIPSVRRFFSHYLPTTTKLLRDYQYLEIQTVKSENISVSMVKIEGALEMLRDAFQKQVNTLFSSTALDLEADIDVLENILKKEGLMEDDFSMNVLSDGKY